MTSSFAINNTITSKLTHTLTPFLSANTCRTLKCKYKRKRFVVFFLKQQQQKKHYGFNVMRFWQGRKDECAGHRSLTFEAIQSNIRFTADETCHTSQHLFEIKTWNVENFIRTPMSSRVKLYDMVSKAGNLSLDVKPFVRVSMSAS